MINKTIEEKLQLLPMEPGCYLMKNNRGEIIYVGKAKRLKNRVSSYFTGAHDHKTTRMVRQIDDFEFIITSTEKESLILEINLIKEHRPRFNIIFMDDKSYPYLKVSRTGRPEVIVSRDRKQSPRFIYFGPYPDATAAREMARLLNDSIPINGELLPNTQAIYAAFNRTGLDYTDDELDLWRQQVVSVLNGNTKRFTDALETKMFEASDAMNFELAQAYKQKLHALNYISDRQQVQFAMNERFDMFNYAYYQGFIAIVGMFVRAGRLLERSMAVEACMEDPHDAFVSFIGQFYENQPLPKSVYVPDMEAKTELNLILNTEINVPQRGKKRTLMEITHKNATQQLDEQFAILRNRQQFKETALASLQSSLESTEPIHRIEIFDNSHISGDFAVSACVVYDDGEPNRQQYRRYRLSTGNDDAASMKEVIYRRYFRLLREGKRMPDLILVDGGKPQLNAAIQVFNDLELNVDVCGLVKDEYHRTHALMKADGSLLDIKKDTPLFNLLMQMQDEVHRYVITYHRKLRGKAMTKSLLDEVPGLGKVRQKALYKEFGSLRGIRNASQQSLAQVVPADVAESLYTLLHIDWDEKHEKN